MALALKCVQVSIVEQAGLQVVSDPLGYLP
jgi:hypothetical protein